MIEKFSYTAEKVMNYMTDEDNDIFVLNYVSLNLWIENMKSVITLKELFLGCFLT